MNYPKLLYDKSKGDVPSWVAVPCMGILYQES